jgi:hypothetical protein
MDLGLALDIRTSSPSIAESLGGALPNASSGAGGCRTLIAGHEALCRARRRIFESVEQRSRAAGSLAFARDRRSLRTLCGI